jgi:hypothetical protein
MTTEAEVAILNRVIEPAVGRLSEEAAHAILALDFAQEDRRRMNDLAEKARNGALTVSENEEVDCYVRLGHLLGLLHSKARIALKNSNGHQ